MTKRQFDVTIENQCGYNKSMQSVQEPNLDHVQFYCAQMHRLRYANAQVSPTPCLPDSRHRIVSFQVQIRYSTRSDIHLTVRLGRLSGRSVRINLLLETQLLTAT
jgi:hypothetical protein